VICRRHFGSLPLLLAATALIYSLCHACLVLLVLLALLSLPLTLSLYTKSTKAKKSMPGVAQRTEHIN
jgi:hypothetical protein